MTDQKHTKELKKINNNRGLNSMQAYLATYNLCDILICRREISESLAKKLGFKRTIVFQKIEDSHDRL